MALQLSVAPVDLIGEPVALAFLGHTAVSALLCSMAVCLQIQRWLEGRRAVDGTAGDDGNVGGGLCDARAMGVAAEHGDAPVRKLLPLR